jgi:hypothetical protein
VDWFERDGARAVMSFAKSEFAPTEERPSGVKLKFSDREIGWRSGCRVRKLSVTSVDGLKYEAR